MSVKTFVITLPKPLPPGAQVKGVITPEMLNESASASQLGQATMDFCGNIVHFIKEEPTQVIEVTDNQKPVRKRQKLDHLTYEEKLMRRKLKNRVAAQTARDRKKLRMDELEIEVSQMKTEIEKMASAMELLTEHNKQLEERNKALEERLTKCSCGTTCFTQRSQPIRSTNVVERKAPVCSVTEQSAVLPQQRAVTLQAVIRALFLTLMYSRLGVLPQRLQSASQEEKVSLLENSLPVSLQHSLSKETSPKWTVHHQPPWIHVISS